MTSTASATSDLWQIDHLESPVDGIKIRYGTWTSPFFEANSNKKWGVLLLNGRSEWIEKYVEVPKDFALGDNVIWATLDHRGQGASEGVRGHVDSYESFAQDAAAVAREVFGDIPYLVLTHSMGGLIALMGVTADLLEPKAMVLCSPLLGLPNEPLHRSLARPIARLMGRSFWSNRPTGFRSRREARFHQNPLTHSYSGFLRVLESPYPYIPPSFGWVAATFAACDRVLSPAALVKVRCPTKLIVGDQESVVDPGAFGLWCIAAQENSCLVEWSRIPEGRHELLNEIPRIRNAVIAQARAWLLQFAPQPSSE